MEQPFRPEGHRVFDAVDTSIKPTLPAFVESETKDPTMALLFSSISSAVKSISSLTR
jgi:hypothetical protein